MSDYYKELENKILTLEARERDNSDKIFAIVVLCFIGFFLTVTMLVVNFKEHDNRLRRTEKIVGIDEIGRKQ